MFLCTMELEPLAFSDPVWYHLTTVVDASFRGIVLCMRAGQKEREK